MTLYGIDKWVYYSPNIPFLHKFLLKIFMVFHKSNRTDGALNKKSFTVNLIAIVWRVDSSDLLILFLILSRELCGGSWGWGKLNKNQFNPIWISLETERKNVNVKRREKKRWTSSVRYIYHKIYMKQPLDVKMNRSWSLGMSFFPSLFVK